MLRYFQEKMNNLFWIAFFPLASNLLSEMGATEDNLCAYSKQAVVKFTKLESGLSEDGDSSAMTGRLLDSNSTEKCPKGSDYCYALWQEDPQNKTVIILLAQGCWDSSGEFDCGSNECISNKRPPKALNNTKFCCCLGEMCNFNVTNIDVPEPSELYPPAFSSVEHASYQTEVLVIALASLLPLIIITVAAMLIFRQWSSSRKHSPDPAGLLESQHAPVPNYDLDNLKIQEVVGRGRFGSVWRGALNEHTVAVKIFVAQNKQYFLNERDIYALPCMEQSCLPKFIGSDDRKGPDNRIEYLLVLSYAPYGCLQEFLRHETVDWPTLSKMSQTMTRGLSHLHTEIRKGDMVKPCIAHRDLNSRNVLVKSDGSCMLCDFGFAIRISGCKYMQNGEEQVAETTSLADVGTLRYMAPEVLEGAVNLRDCESSLKQIDVYALGLVLWEIATRCSDLYQGMEVPPYKLPFECEVGLHPSMEQMQVLVTRNKARPLFPDIWKASNPAIRSLKETIEDCWDHDAEARLTALCVEERLAELPVLWERHKAGNTVPGVSPTINQTSCNQRPTTLVCLSSSSSGSQIGNGTFPDSSEKNVQCIIRRSSVSEATSDTILTMSPLDSTTSLVPVSNNLCNGLPKNNCTNNMAAQLMVPLQPHQGRNPCMERNLMMEPTEELGIHGNMLLEKGKDVQTLVRNMDSDTMHLLENNESNLGVTSEVAPTNQPTIRACNPIPYVQNAVHVAGTMPKQPNLPGNGHHSLATQNEGLKKDKTKRNPFRIFAKKKRSSESSFRSGLRNFLDRRKASNGSNILAEDEQPLKGSPVSEKTCSPIQESNCQIGNNLDSSLYGRNIYRNVSPVVTEVSIVNTGPNSSLQHTVVRPVLNGHAAILSDTSSEFLRHRGSLLSFDSRMFEITKDINDNCNSESTLDPKKIRPSTLPVVKAFKPQVRPSEKIANGHTAMQINGLKNEVGIRQKQIKTPLKVKNGRFSLHNDRIMVSQDLEPNFDHIQELNGSAIMSSSVPLNMDSLRDENSFARCSTVDPKHSSPTV